MFPFQSEGARGVESIVSSDDEVQFIGVQSATVEAVAPQSPVTVKQEIVPACPKLELFKKRLEESRKRARALESTVITAEAGAATNLTRLPSFSVPNGTAISQSPLSVVRTPSPPSVSPLITATTQTAAVAVTAPALPQQLQPLPPAEMPSIDQLHASGSNYVITPEQFLQYRVLLGQYELLSKAPSASASRSVASSPRSASQLY